ncbi:MAG: GtrA family protein [Nitrospira sp.]|nr:GtrA family protein [Nitrospira sp.]
MELWRRCLDISRRLAGEHETKLRFVLAGAFNTTLGLAAYPALFFLLRPFDFHYLTVLAISQILCVTAAFLTNKFLVFRTSGNYLNEYGRFVTFHLSYFLVNLVALPFLVEIMHMNPVWAQTLFAALVIVSSYFWHSRITFRTDKAIH